MIVGLILDIVLICLYIGFAIYVYCKNKKQEKDIYEFKTGMNKGYLIFSIVFDSIAFILIAISIALYFENTPEGVWVCFGMALFIGVLSNVILYDNILDYYSKDDLNKYGYDTMNKKEISKEELDNFSKNRGKFEITNPHDKYQLEQEIKDYYGDTIDENPLLDEIPIFLEDGTFNSDNPRASERMNEIEKYLRDYGIQSPTDVYNHLLDSGYSDEQISEIVDNDYISDYDIMEGITSHSDLGERALMGMTPREMLGDRVSNWIDYGRLKNDLTYDVDDMWREYQNENGITDDMDNYYDGYDDYYNEIEDEFIQNAGERLDDYFDYDKFGYDLAMSDYYYDEDTGIASRNN